MNKLTVILLTALLVGCGGPEFITAQSDSASGATGLGGEAATGGDAGETGGNSSGGQSNTGGSVEETGGTGGFVEETGGTASTGGTVETGGTGGDIEETGGSANTGGTQETGGASSGGGGTGGVVSTGGVEATGGAISTGGVVATGGSSGGTGGGVSTGGQGTGGIVSVCDNGDTECVGDTPRSCVGGQWVNGSACTFVCSAGSCTGVCEPGAKDCSGDVPRTCNSMGQWVSSSACEFLCSAGACTGVCEPGTKRCSGTGTQTCNASGQWGTITACPTDAHEVASCTGNGTCGASCADGWGDVDGNPANGCEGDIYNDAENCGAPGNSCFGGTCSTGVCSFPEFVNVATWDLTSYNVAFGIATDGSYVYAQTDFGQILKTPVDGGSPTVLASGFSLAYANNLVVENGEVFWVAGAPYGTRTQTAGLYKVSVNGGTVTKLSNSTPRRFDVEGGYVYWLDGYLNPADFCKSNCTATKFWKVPTAGGSTTNPFSFATLNGGYHAQVKVVGSSLYVTRMMYFSAYGTFNGDIYSANLATGALLKAMSGATTDGTAIGHNFGAMALNSTNLFYGSMVDTDVSSTDNSQSALRRASLTAATPSNSNIHLNYEPSLTYNGDTQYFDLEADDTYAYYIKSNRLVRSSVNGGAGQYLSPTATAQHSVKSIATDGQYVYWSAISNTGGKGYLFRQPK